MESQSRPHNATTRALQTIFNYLSAQPGDIAALQIFNKLEATLHLEKSKKGFRKFKQMIYALKPKYQDYEIHVAGKDFDNAQVTFKPKTRRPLDERMRQNTETKVMLGKALWSELF